MHEDIGYDSINPDHSVTEYTVTPSLEVAPPAITTPTYAMVAYANINTTYYVQMRNNIVVPTVPPTGRDIQLLERLNNGVAFRSMPKGLYIVETIYSPKTERKDIMAFVDYYSASRGFGYSKETSDLIRDMMVNRYTNNTCISGRIAKDYQGTHNGAYPFSLSIVTYVPASTIRDHSYVYVNGPGVAVTDTVPEYCAKNPYSREHLEVAIANRDIPSDSTSVNIVLVTDDTTPRYINIGKDTVKILPLVGKEASALPSGCGITRYRKGKMVDEKFITQEEFSDNGIFKTRELCLADGDQTLALEKLKLTTELNKAKLELDKVKEAKSKLKLEGESRKAAFAQDLAGRKMDLITTSAKTKIKMLESADTTRTVIQKNKSNTIAVMTKLRADVARSRLDVHKAMLSVHNELAKGVRDKELHQLKIIDTSARLVAGLLK